MSHHPKQENICFVRMLFMPGSFDLNEKEDMTSPMNEVISFDTASVRHLSNCGSILRLSLTFACSMDFTSSMTLTRRGRGSISLRLSFFLKRQDFLRSRDVHIQPQVYGIFFHFQLAS